MEFDTNDICNCLFDFVVLLIFHFFYFVSLFAILNALKHIVNIFRFKWLVIEFKQICSSITVGLSEFGTTKSMWRMYNIERGSNEC